MWDSEDTAKSCELLSRKMNEHLKFYKSHLESFKKQFIELESLKFDSLFESIHQTIVFDTACDMNNKYDTKGFSDLVEEIDWDGYLSKITMSKLDWTGKYSFSIKDEIRD